MPETTARNTEGLRSALAARYPSDAWALMWEVADATGMKHTRWADAVAMSLWPSRGLRLHGFECKVSRSDWQKELKQPAKAESICRYCDHWWIVVSDKSIVRPGELPPAWGLMVQNSKGVLRTEVDAPKLDAQPITREFLAALLRAAAKPGVAVNAVALQREYARGRDYEMGVQGKIAKRATEELDKLQKVVADFEAKAGFQIRSWGGTPERIGQIVRDVLNGKHEPNITDLRRIRGAASNILERIDESGLLKEDSAPA